MSFSQIVFVVAFFIAPAASAADDDVPPPTWGDDSVTASNLDWNMLVEPHKSKEK